MAAAERVRRQLWPRCGGGVCSGAGLERERIIDLSAAWSAGRFSPWGHGRHGRYRLLETLRLYGVERLAEAGEDVEMARKHAAWYAELVSRWGSPLVGELPGRARSTTRWTSNGPTSRRHLSSSLGPRLDPEIGLRMAADLWLYWLVRGRYRAGRGRLEALLAMAPVTPNRAMALWAFGFLSQATGDYSTALFGARGGAAGLRSDGRGPRAGVRPPWARVGSSALGPHRAGGRSGCPVARTDAAGRRSNGARSFFTSLRPLPPRRPVGGRAAPRQRRAASQ